MRLVCKCRLSKADPIASLTADGYQPWQPPAPSPPDLVPVGYDSNEYYWNVLGGELNVPQVNADSFDRTLPTPGWGYDYNVGYFGYTPYAGYGYWWDGSLMSPPDSTSQWESPEGSSISQISQTVQNFTINPTPADSQPVSGGLGSGIFGIQAT